MSVPLRILICFVAIDGIAWLSAVRAQPALLATAATPISAVAEDIEPPPEEICQTDIRVSGTLFDAARPTHSFAMLQVGGANQHGAVYRVGSQIGGFVLSAVEPRGVRLRDEQGDCWLRLIGISSPPPRAAGHKTVRTAAHRVRTRATAFSAAELDHGIHGVAPGRFEVERALLAKAVARAAQIAQTMQLRQELRHGEASGLIVQRILDDGLLHHLGIRRGDVLRTFNGLPLTSLDGVLRAQTQLTSAPRLSLLVMRGGQPTTLDYRLVD